METESHCDRKGHSKNKNDVVSCVESSKKIKKSKKERKRKHSSSSDHTENEHSKSKRKKKCKKRHKHNKEKSQKRDKSKDKNKDKNKPDEKNEHEEDALVGPEIPEVLDKSKSMAPMSKEEWEKRQKVTRRVYDEDSGRTRLIKGDGEVLEEIVSRERHNEINRQATIADGNAFQSKLKSWVKK